MMNPLKRIGLILTIVLLAGAFLRAADPAAYKAALQAGLAHYDDNELDQAEAKFLEAERAASNDQQRAKARYHLGLIYYKQKNWEKALAAFEAADKLDPKTTFTKNTAQYRQKLTTARANVAAGAQKRGPAPRAPQSGDPMHAAVIKALASSDQGGLWDFANLLDANQKKEIESRIRAAARNGLYLYVVTVDLQSGGRALSIFTDQIFRERGFKKGETLFVISNNGVYGKSADIPTDKLNALIQSSRRAFMNSYGDGIAALLDNVRGQASSERSKSAARTGVLSLLGIGAIVAIVLGIFSSRKKKAAAFDSKFAEAVQLESEVLEQLDIARTKVNLGGESHLKDLMRRVEQRYMDAHNALEQLKSERARMDVTRAEAIVGLLRGILADLDQIKSGQEPSGTSYAPEAGPGPAGVGPAAGPATGPYDGNCFFCSNPVNSQTAERVRITMGDQEQWVLMCPYCADYRRRTGQMPRVLARNYQGQSVHWKDDPTYTPPAQPQPVSPQQGGGFFGGGGMSFLDMWMLSNLFNRPSHDRVIFVDQESGRRGSDFSYDVDESRSRSAGSSYRHQASADPDERRAAPGMDFYSSDRS